MINLNNQMFHMVEMSPWPLIMSINIMMMMMSTILWFQLNTNTMLIMSVIILMISCFQWWRDVSRESTMQGLHTKEVINLLKWGMILFITSEVMFFLSFFWNFFHASLSPSMEIGMKWPPTGIVPFNPMNIPLLNTIVLLSSGITITMSHHSLMMGIKKSTEMYMNLTISLGVYFTMLQGQEYFDSQFSISDSIYGTSFFVATGFHGLHVIVGSLFLMVVSLRLAKKHFSNTHHVGFEAAAWYWHFVDVVWLFLYINIYW